MPVSDPTAFKLLRAFGMLEFRLKQTSDFLGWHGDQPEEGKLAQVKWQAVDHSAARLPAPLFMDRISKQTLQKFLGGDRDRPQKQILRRAGDHWIAEFESKRLPTNDAEAMVVGMRRVRNNLFHGGKEDPLEERFEGDDEQWALAAYEIAALLIELVDTGDLQNAVP